MAAPRGPRDVVRAVAALIPEDERAVKQAVVANPPTTGNSVRVLLDPGSATVTVVRRFTWVPAPAAGDTVWLLRAGRTYLCLGSLA